MDYKALALEFMQKMYKLRQARPQKQINESMHGEHFILQFIAFHNRSVLPSEISNEMGISSARIAATLNSLERKGMIVRQIDISDRRRILVDLTPQGKSLAEEHHKEAIEMLTKVLGALGEQDAREYVRITGKLAEKASQFRETK
jgi:MarR family transcriptional regulator, organic hydroperoxide resistance regulator